ncbi:MAG: hypothetical protein NC342_04115 [Pseudoflavonifractor sp.]|nr:hypothetical protein [Alloprevotella sp.]MCM1116701.1 hypothetical protein [Pseudoflavonifractor sp.]
MAHQIGSKAPLQGYLHSGRGGQEVEQLAYPGKKWLLIFVAVDGYV